MQLKRVEKPDLLKNAQQVFLKKRKKKVINEVKRIDQKKMDMIFWSGFLGIIGLCTVTVLLSFTREMRPVKVEQPKVAVEADPNKIDNRLQEFLGAYIDAYFTVSSTVEDYKKQVEHLNSFYNFPPIVKGQIKEPVPSALISYRLLEVKDNMASYRVTYETGQEDKQRVTVLFGVPFGGEEGAYYVSGLPHFKAVPDYRAKKVKRSENLLLDARDDLLEGQRQELNDFLKLFFTNYTTSQENLDVISKGLIAVNGVGFESVDYSYFKLDGEKATAYAQVSFTVLGVRHAENFTLELEKRDNGYFVTELKHVIPADYAG